MVRPRFFEAARQTSRKNWTDVSQKKWIPALKQNVSATNISATNIRKKKQSSTERIKKQSVSPFCWPFQQSSQMNNEHYSIIRRMTSIQNILCI